MKSLYINLKSIPASKKSYLTIDILHDILYENLVKYGIDTDQVLYGDKVKRDELRKRLEAELAK